MNRCVFFDRDGVLNHAFNINGKPCPPWSLNDVILEDGAAELIHHIKQRGWLTIIVTNQPDAARGDVDLLTLKNIQEHIAERLQVDDAFACYHDNSDNCQCRKPKIGMFLEAQRKYDIDFSVSRFVGDRKSDADASKVANIPFVWKNNDFEEPKPVHFIGQIKQTTQVLDFL